MYLSQLPLCGGPGERSVPLEGTVWGLLGTWTSVRLPKSCRGGGAQPPIPLWPRAGHLTLAELHVLSGSLCHHPSTAGNIRTTIPESI